MPRMPLTVAVALLLVLGLAPGRAEADGGWLNGPVEDWNRPGMAIPPAPTGVMVVNPTCPAGRLPESPREQAVVDAGWKLYGSYTRGAPVEEMYGLAGNDGMCRPMQFQVFVFVDGAFAGTLSPTPMDSRTDGSLSSLEIKNEETFTARYTRYTSQDALCCPSAISTAVFEIDRSGAGPIVSLRNLVTEATGMQPAMPGPSTVPPGAAPAQAPAQVPRRN